jgi:hypothetical protein
MASTRHFTQRNSNGRNGGFDDLSGSKLSMIPRNVYGLSARYRLPLASDIGKVSAKVNVYRQSDMQITDINNNATNPIAWPGEGTVKGYHLVMPRLTGHRSWATPSTCASMSRTCRMKSMQRVA